MAKLLILFAHPLLEQSRIHTELIKRAKKIKDVTVNDLYEQYPDFDIDVEREKRLLLAHDIIAWQFPFYWYSAPPLLKQWQDLVLEHGWAYGKKGTALEGKKVFNIFTSGAGADAYQYEGFNKYPIHDFLKPFERTVELCRMQYWPPLWFHGMHRMEAAQIRQHCDQYEKILTALTTELFADDEITSHELMNGLFPLTLIND